MAIEQRVATQNQRDIVGIRISALDSMMRRYAKAAPQAEAFIRGEAITQAISLETNREVAEGMTRRVPEATTTTEAYINDFIHKLSRMNEASDEERKVASGAVTTVATMLENVFEVKQRQRLNTIDVVPRGVEEVIIFHGREGRTNGHASDNVQPKPAARLIDVAGA